MASLVADYGSSSENDDSETDDSLWKTSNQDDDDDDDNDDDDDVSTEKSSPVLENPFRTVLNESNNGIKKNCQETGAISLTAPVSVFSNPYKEVEDAQQLLLEKHVKMTPNQSQTCSNGRQICWNYQKGRCRFGHNCKFAHDSDLPAAVNPNESDSPVPKDQEVVVLKEDSLGTKKCERKKKKRPGLSQTLIPSKKVMKHFYSQVQQEKPWLVTK